MADRRDHSHWVYALRETYTGTIKIGRARSFDHIDQRLRANQVGCPYQLEIIRRLEPGQHVGEHKLHQQLSAYRMRDNGEWFIGTETVYRALGLVRGEMPMGPEALLLEMLDKERRRVAYTAEWLDAERAVVNKQQTILQWAGKMLASAGHMHFYPELQSIYESIEAGSTTHAPNTPTPNQEDQQ